MKHHDRTGERNREIKKHHFIPNLKSIAQARRHRGLCLGRVALLLRALPRAALAAMTTHTSRIGPGEGSAAQEGSDAGLDAQGGEAVAVGRGVAEGQEGRQGLLAHLKSL